LRGKRLFHVAAFLLVLLGVLLAFGLLGEVLLPAFLGRLLRGGAVLVDGLLGLAALLGAAVLLRVHPAERGLQLRGADPAVAVGVDLVDVERRLRGGLLHGSLPVAFLGGRLLDRVASLFGGS